MRGRHESDCDEMGPEAKVYAGGREDHPFVSGLGGFVCMGPGASFENGFRSEGEGGWGACGVIYNMLYIRNGEKEV